MGLCKCPKKKVTNQFCFEHRVNVCEYCMVSNHPKCVIQSYLLWLQDSDYNPNCSLCSEELNNEECIRLLCYHVYHWRCLDAFAKNLPQNTAPAGYSCPTCQGPIFPANNVVSPIADHVRNTLTRVNWAREGLGLPLLNDSVSYSTNTSSDGRVQNIEANDMANNGLPQMSSNPQLSHSINNVSPPAVATSNQKYESVISVADSSDYRAQNRSSDKILSVNSVSSPRKLFDSTKEYAMNQGTLDHDENKYKRRSAFEWLSRWFKSRMNAKGRQSGHLYRRYVILLVILFLVLVTIIMIFSHVGRLSAEHDPMLDPKRNPVIRIQGDN